MNMRQLLAIGLLSTLLLPVTPLLAAPARDGRISSVPAAAGAAGVAGMVGMTGMIDGRARIAGGQAPSTSVQLRDLETGQLVAKTTCNAEGHFSFAGRRPGNYSVELVNPAGAIVAASAAFGVPAAATANVTIAPSTATGSGRASGGGASTASVVTATAVAAGIPTVVATRRHPSPSF
jgi:hypothetical protein